MNLKPLVEAFNYILAHPETWDQKRWHCGTKHCLFGHCQILAGLPAESSSCIDDVVRLTGISYDDAAWLSYGWRSLSEMRAFLVATLAGTPFFDADGYDRHGYDRAGYDRHGYNRNGYNRDGYDRHGYDQYGYDRDGYDRLGYDQRGYDRHGYDRDGYNRHGYDRHGYDRLGYDRDGQRLQPIPLS